MEPEKRAREDEVTTVIKKVKLEIPTLLSSTPSSDSIFKYLTEASWLEMIGGDLMSKQIKGLEAFLKTEFENKTIYPPKEDIFNALNLIPVKEIKVVIIGQDPYFNGQANGLAFSVHKGIRNPPSLENIITEVKRDTNVQVNSGDLNSWAKQGVLLLNTILTVEKGKAMSHAQKGWEFVTTRIIQRLSIKNDYIVFMLWGGNAKGLATHINIKKHSVLESTHPSPKSAGSGRNPFLGSKHFSKANRLLELKGRKKIDWTIA